jgi:hypothetical protein
VRTIRLIGLSTPLALALGFALAAYGGIRGPGTYCGVVVFDRWDTCFLLSGHFIMYVSESVKNVLRSYKGQAVQVDAFEVFQPINPGDGLIRAYKVIGPAPDTQKRAKLDGLELVAESAFDAQGTPSFMIRIRNTSNEAVRIVRSEIGPTLLTRKFTSSLLSLFSNPWKLDACEFGPFDPTDGDSVAVITRVNLSNSFSEAWCKVGSSKFPVGFAIDLKTQLPERFDLLTQQSVSTKITFQAPPGQYQFLFGYGGGVHEEKSLASNAISFDVSNNGVATLVQ